MGQAHTRLAATMLLALGSLATAADAVRAEAVVVAATAPGYTAGQQLGTDPITVPDGATLVFLLKTGQVVTVKGPYVYVLAIIRARARNRGAFSAHII